jgi:hypothetical protein
MEDQRERVADASFAFVRRHHLRRLALSLVELASQHHLSPLHLPPSREGKEDRRWVDIIKMDTNGDEGSLGVVNAVNADKRSIGVVEAFDADNHHVTGFPRSIGRFEDVESH